MPHSELSTSLRLSCKTNDSVAIQALWKDLPESLIDSSERKIASLVIPFLIPRSANLFQDKRQWTYRWMRDDQVHGEFPQSSLILLLPDDASHLVCNFDKIARDNI